MAVGVVIAAVALYLFLTRRPWFGQHLPLALHPSSPRPAPYRGWPAGCGRTCAEEHANHFIPKGSLGTLMGMMHHHRSDSSMGLIVAIVGLIVFALLVYELMMNRTWIMQHIPPEVKQAMPEPVAKALE